MIQVSVQSSTTPNLSLIDLPGIIRTTIYGQEKRVIANVNDLLDSFMRQPETIILAVIPANQDIATIDVLERAYEYDPAGVRTIGVLTKPDLIDRGNHDDNGDDDSVDDDDDVMMVIMIEIMIIVIIMIIMMMMIIQL